MRLLVLLAASAVVVPATAPAAPRLIGRDSRGPLRLLDRDLRVVKGSAPIPRRHTQTLRSPNGKRFLAAGDRNLYVINRRTGRRLFRRSIPRNSRPVLWPSRHRILLTPFRRVNSSPSLVRLDLATGRRRPVAIPEGRVDVVDGELRVLTQRPGGAPAVVHEVRPSGSVRRSVTLPLPPGLFTETITSEWVGDKLVISNPDLDRLLLVSFDGDAATVHPLDLEPDGWEAVTPTLLYDGGLSRTLARIDPGTGAVLRTADVPHDFDVPRVFDVSTYESAIPYAGGAIVGGGRLRYGADLQVVATNPEARPERGGRALRLGNRVYAPTRDCTADTFTPVTLRIVDADSLRTIRTRRLYKIARIGYPTDFVQAFDCD